MRLCLTTPRDTPPAFNRGDSVRIIGTEHVGRVTGKKGHDCQSDAYRVFVEAFDGERTIYESKLERVSDDF